MKKIGLVLLAILLGFGSLTKIAAQDSDTAKKEEPRRKDGPLIGYRVEFVLSEFDGERKINSRKYSMLLQDGLRNKLRIGGRVPLALSSTNNPQFQYVDMGMNIDCTIQEHEGRLQLESTIDSSGISRPMAQEDAVASKTVIRQFRTEVNTILESGKLTPMVTMDDPTGKGQFQLEVTATKLK